MRNSAHDSITAQILTETDSMKYLDNIRIIGTTNIIIVIDPALFHTGRLDTLIEVGLPDRKGRPEILNIYTKTMLKSSLMSDDADTERLIHETHGMIEAHIEQLVRQAVHSTMKRDLQNYRTLRISNEDAEKLQVMNIDFTVALQKLKTQTEKHTTF